MIYSYNLLISYSIEKILVLILFATFLSPILSLSQKTIILQPNAIEGIDAAIHGLGSEVNKNYGYIPQFSANSWTFEGIRGVVRSVMKFDLSSLPQNAQIQKATLSLYAWGSDTGFGQHSNRGGSNKSWLQRITEPWDENEVTWNTQPATTTQGQISIHQSNFPDEDYTDIDITEMITMMQRRPESNFGFMIRLQEELLYQMLNFASSDHEDPNLRPKLTIEYLDNWDWKIYPNPTRHDLTFEITGTYAPEMKLTVYNTLGQSILTFENVPKMYTMNLSFLTAGVYYFQVELGDKKKVLKLAVQ